MAAATMKDVQDLLVREFGFGHPITTSVMSALASGETTPEQVMQSWTDGQCDSMAKVERLMAGEMTPDEVGAELLRGAQAIRRLTEGGG